MVSLFPYQIEGVKKMTDFLRSAGCCYNASEMGLGKTAMTVRTLETFLPPKSKILIICPAVVTLVWETEVMKWAVDTKNEYTIISYDKAKTDHWLKDILSRKWEALVLDEAHYVKNPRAKRYNILRYTWPKIKYKICLSGTPFTQSIMDAWPIFSRMSPEDFKDWSTFENRYCNIERTPWGIKHVGIKNHEELREIINKKFFFRFLKKDVAKDLPEKIFQRIPLGDEYLIKRTEEELKAHQRYIALFQAAIKKGFGIPTPPIAIATQNREQGLKKLPAIIEFCQNILDSGEPLVIFCVHLELLEKLKNGLRQYNPQVITGATTEASRQAAIDGLQSGRSNLFIGQVKAAGIGVTLTAARYCVFAELDYSPAVVSQAIDRLHRIGQKSTVNIYWFSVIGSGDEKIEEILFNKSSDFKKVLGD